MGSTDKSSTAQPSVKSQSVSIKDEPASLEKELFALEGKILALEENVFKIFGDYHYNLTTRNKKKDESLDNEKEDLLTDLKFKINRDVAVKIEIENLKEEKKELNKQEQLESQSEEISKLKDQQEKISKSIEMLADTLNTDHKIQAMVDYVAFLHKELQDKFFELRKNYTFYREFLNPEQGEEIRTKLNSTLENLKELPKKVNEAQKFNEEKSSLPEKLDDLERIDTQITTLLADLSQKEVSHKETLANANQLTNDYLELNKGFNDLQKEQEKLTNSLMGFCGAVRRKNQALAIEGKDNVFYETSYKLETSNFKNVKNAFKGDVSLLKTSTNKKEKTGVITQQLQEVVDKLKAMPIMLDSFTSTEQEFIINVSDTAYQISEKVKEEKVTYDEKDGKKPLNSKSLSQSKTAKEALKSLQISVQENIKKIEAKIIEDEKAEADRIANEARQLKLQAQATPAPAAAPNPHENDTQPPADIATTTNTYAPVLPKETKRLSDADLILQNALIKEVTKYFDSRHTGFLGNLTTLLFRNDDLTWAKMGLAQHFVNKVKEIMQGGNNNKESELNLLAERCKYTDYILKRLAKSDEAKDKEDLVVLAGFSRKFLAGGNEGAKNYQSFCEKLKGIHEGEIKEYGRLYQPAESSGLNRCFDKCLDIIDKSNMEKLAVSMAPRYKQP